MYVVKLKRRNEIAGEMWLSYTDLGFFWISNYHKCLLFFNCFEVTEILDELKINYADVEIKRLWELKLKNV